MLVASPSPRSRFIGSEVLPPIESNLTLPDNTPPPATTDTRLNVSTTLSTQHLDTPTHTNDPEEAITYTIARTKSDTEPQVNSPIEETDHDNQTEQTNLPISTADTPQSVPPNTEKDPQTRDVHT